MIKAHETLRNFYLPVIGLAIFIASYALRSWRLSFQPLSSDEIFTHYISNLPSWSAIIDTITHQESTNPPLYWILRHAVNLATDNSRITSVICSALVIPAAVYFFRVFNSRVVTLSFIAIYCFSLPSIEVAQDDRVYSLAILLATMTTGLWFRVFCTDTPSNKIQLCILLLTSSLLSYSHYFGTILVFAQGVSVGLFFPWNRTIFKKWCVVYLGSFVLFLPWLPIALRAANLPNFWIQPPKISFFFQMPELLTGGSARLQVGFYALLCLGGFAGLKNKTYGFFQIKLLLFWTTLFFVIPFCLSYFTLPFLTPKYLLICLPVFLLTISLLIRELPRKARLPCLILWVAMSGQHVRDSQYYSFIRKNDLRTLTYELVDKTNSSSPVGLICCANAPIYCTHFLQKWGHRFELLAMECHSGKISDIVNNSTAAKDKEYAVVFDKDVASDQNDITWPQLENQFSALPVKSNGYWAWLLKRR